MGLTKSSHAAITLSSQGDVAQLVRAPALQAGSPQFESVLPHHFKLQIP